MNVETAQKLLEIIAMAVVLVIVLPAHEFAHAYSAYKCGDLTAKNMGRMTLNPLKHLNPVGYAMMLFVGFGFAKPVPVNPNNFRNYRKGMFWTSISGVLTNLALGMFFVIPYVALLQYAPDFVDAAISGENLIGYLGYTILALLFYSNIGLFVLNLLPIFPLDGFRLIESCTRQSNRYRQFMYKWGFRIFFGLLLESLLADFLWRSTGIPLFHYLDLLGMFMETVVHWIAQPMVLLWSIIFR